MKNNSRIYKENISNEIRKVVFILFIVAVFIFITIGSSYFDAMKGSTPIQEYKDALTYENSENLSGTFVRLEASDIQNYYVAFKNNGSEDYYYYYKDSHSGLFLTLSVELSQKEEIEQIIKNNGSIELEGSLFLLNDSAVEVGKQVIEQNGEVLGENFWNYVSPYYVNVNRLSVFSVNTTAFIFYGTIIFTILCIGIYVYLKTDSWLNLKWKQGSLKTNLQSEEIKNDLNKANVISLKGNKILLGKEYIYFNESFNPNKYNVTKMKDLRWIQIRKYSLLFVIKDYAFTSVDKDGNEKMLLIAKGKKEMEQVIDKMIRSNDKLILGDIEELREKRLSLKRDKEEVMKIVNQLYKENTYDYMKEEK